jgi:hypothetical protein
LSSEFSEATSSCSDTPATALLSGGILPFKPTKGDDVSFSFPDFLRIEKKLESFPLIEDFTFLGLASSFGVVGSLR